MFTSCRAPVDLAGIGDPGRVLVARQQVPIVARDNEGLAGQDIEKSAVRILADTKRGLKGPRAMMAAYRW
jgi:hypothetical protein